METLFGNLLCMVINTAVMLKVDGSCEVNSTIISFREDVSPGTVIMRIPRALGEQWSFREDGPRGFVELRALQHTVIIYFSRTPDLEELNNQTASVRESLPFTLECSFGGWKHVFKQEIALIDVNDNDPEFDPNQPSTITVSESTSPGTVVLKLNGYARDPDVTGRITTYDIAHHIDEENDGYEYFGISKTGSELVVRHNLDFDLLRQNGRSFYVLNLTAVDNGFPFTRVAYTTLLVQVSDSDDQGPAFVYPDCPKFDGYCLTPLYETVTKMAFAGKLRIWPAQIRAVDKDTLNNSIGYFIIKVMPEEFSPHFVMDMKTGEVRVVKPFETEDHDAILIAIKVEEVSAFRHFTAATLRIQVVGDFYTSRNDHLRGVPINEVINANPHNENSTDNVTVSLFIVSVVLFLLVVLTFPFIIVKILKGKLLSEPAKVTSLQLMDSNGSPQSSRKESNDTATTSITSCTSTDVECNTDRPRDDCDSVSTTSSSSSSSYALGCGSSNHLSYEDAISFVNPKTQDGRRISSVSFDPEEVSTRFNPALPKRHEENARDRLKRRLSQLMTLNSLRDNRKTRVRFDIRNISNAA